MQGDGHVFAAGPHFEGIVRSVEDDVVRRRAEVDPFEEIRLHPLDADVDRARGGRGVDHAQPGLTGGDRPQIGAGDREREVLSFAGGQDYVGLSGVEIERGVDDRFLDRRVFGGDAHYSFDQPRQEGLIGLSQAALWLPLRPGANEILLITSDGFGGFGLMGQLEPQEGVTLVSP